MSEWRPIISAPRDGTLIEVMDDDAGRFAMMWNPAGQNPIAAGPMRNSRMINARPDLVVAFPGNAGTRDCKRQARRALISVREIKEGQVCGVT